MAYQLAQHIVGSSDIMRVSHLDNDLYSRMFDVQNLDFISCLDQPGLLVIEVSQCYDLIEVIAIEHNDTLTTHSYTEREMESMSDNCRAWNGKCSGGATATSY